MHTTADGIQPLAEMLHCTPADALLIEPWPGGLVVAYEASGTGTASPPPPSPLADHMAAADVVALENRLTQQAGPVRARHTIDGATYDGWVSPRGILVRRRQPPPTLHDLADANTLDPALLRALDQHLQQRHHVLITGCDPTAARAVLAALAVQHAAQHPPVVIDRTGELGLYRHRVLHFSAYMCGGWMESLGLAMRFPAGRITISDLSAFAPAAIRAGLTAPWTGWLPQGDAAAFAQQASGPAAPTTWVDLDRADVSVIEPDGSVHPPPNAEPAGDIPPPRLPALPIGGDIPPGTTPGERVDSLVFGTRALNAALDRAFGDAAPDYAAVLSGFHDWAGRDGSRVRVLCPPMTFAPPTVLTTPSRFPLISETAAQARLSQAQHEQITKALAAPLMVLVTSADPDDLLAGMETVCSLLPENERVVCYQPGAPQLILRRKHVLHLSPALRPTPPRYWDEAAFIAEASVYAYCPRFVWQPVLPTSIRAFLDLICQQPLIAGLLAHGPADAVNRLTAWTAAAYPQLDAAEVRALALPRPRFYVSWRRDAAGTLVCEITTGKRSEGT